MEKKWIQEEKGPEEEGEGGERERRTFVVELLKVVDFVLVFIVAVMADPDAPIFESAAVFPPAQ